MSDLPRVLNELKDGTFQSAEEKFADMRGSGRPEGYYLDSRERVPSVTTITGRFKDSGGLIKWANNEGLAGRVIYQDSAALNIGSIVHHMVEARLHGEEPKPPAIEDELYERVMSGFNAFTRWFDGGKFKVLATEMPLISEKYRYGGTPDAVLIDTDGRYCLGDWKTSNSIYVDYLLQLAAYGQLWNERAPERLKLEGGFHLVRFSKEHGDMEHRHFPHLDDALEMFLLLRQAYEMDKELKRRVK